MRTRVGTAVAVLCVWVGAAAAQPGAAPELPATLSDPFRDSFFQPASGTGRDPGAPFAPLADAVARNDARAIAVPPEAARCACDPDFAAWASAELLIGRTRGPSVAPLVTTGPAGAGLLAGAVGVPGTVPLFGGRRLLDDWRTGLRVELGAWFDPAHRTGVALRLYSLFSTNEQFRAAPNGTVVLNVPQTVSAGALTVQVPAFVGFPGLTAGRASASAQTTFAGGDLNWRCALDRGDRVRAELLVGYRQLHLADELNVNFAVGPAGDGALVAPLLSGGDDVRTRNNFFGPQLGLLAATGGERVWVEGHAAAALGATVSERDFSRARTLAFGGDPVALPAAGVPLVRSASSDRLTYFGVVAEGGVRANWRAADRVRLTSGYSFLYWNDVRRAQEAFAVGPALRPRAVDFATHLFSVGLDVRF